MGDQTLTAASTTDQIREVLARYCQFCDDGRFDEFAQLFTESAQFAVMGTVHEGRDAIVAFMSAAQPPERRGKHMTSNTVIELDVSGAAATVFTDYVFVGRRKDGSFALTSVGRYHDRMRRDADGRWRISRREIVFLGDAVADVVQPLPG
jgi:uncharacterized protein (TIGR02246 family)